ncbi:MAG TPA: hypothetical protein PKE63_02535 [Lacibacter sp.]|nr:hypothetical protein [Lacibacter sp.]HMO89926.1 hypothetical protein [Lacibacter sp.]HMP86123.1 hypothetical protein [Lacibacter sp.]
MRYCNTTGATPATQPAGGWLLLLCCMLLHGTTILAQQAAISMQEMRTVMRVPEKKHTLPGRDSLTYKPQLAGASFMAGHLFSRRYHVLPGRIGARLQNDNFTSDLYEADLQPRQSISGQLNFFGVMFNDVVDKPQSRFWSNLFLYYAAKATWNWVPPNSAAKSGVQHHVELGVDFGARYFPAKPVCLEAGVMLQPLAMSYISLINIPVPDVVFPSGVVVNEIELGSFHMYVGAVPFVRAGLYPLRQLSIDCTLGYHATLRYLNVLNLSPARNGSRVDSDLVRADPANLTFNQRPFSFRDYSFNGRMAGIGITFHMK